MKTSLDKILDKEAEFITRRDKFYDEEDVAKYTSHLEYLNSQGYKIGMTIPDKRNFHLSLYNSENDKLITKRYSK